ncbi:MAG: restriction endonuclease subunit S [Myxococcales bacterium]
MTISLARDWGTKRVKHVSHLVTSGSRGWAEFYADDGPLFIRIGNLTEQGIDLDLADLQHVHVPAGTEGARTRVKQGDVLVSITALIGAVGLVRHAIGESYVNQHLALVRPTSSVDARWLAYALRSQLGRDQFMLRMYGGTKAGLGLDDVREVAVPLPPLHTQRVLADFLDRKTTAIDALIAKKERLIVLLQEKRQALITQAVTKGLNPNVPMKESGFPWLGLVPAHWVVNKLRRIAKRVDVGIAEAATHAYAEAGVPIIRSTNVANNRFDPAHLLYVEPWFAEKNRSKYLWARDLVTVRTGNAGVTAVVPPSLDRSQCFTLLMTTLRHEHNPEFFAYQLNCDAGRTYFALESWGTAQQNISVPILGDMKVAVPPPLEQQAIVRHIEKSLGSADRLLGAVSSHIEKLREYRQALITAAVTGKIDVSSEAA